LEERLAKKSLKGRWEGKGEGWERMKGKKGRQERWKEKAGRKLGAVAWDRN
jgi:hypothetical protein